MVPCAIKSGANRFGRWDQCLEVFYRRRYMVFRVKSNKFTERRQHQSCDGYLLDFLIFGADLVVGLGELILALGVWISSDSSSESSMTSFLCLLARLLVSSTVAVALLFFVCCLIFGPPVGFLAVDWVGTPS